VDIRIDQHDQWHIAVFLRDGEPWDFDGALDGRGPSEELALHDLLAVARQLVIDGKDFLTKSPLSLADREWLIQQGCGERTC
jgi:hypothetical protein